MNIDYTAIAAWAAVAASITAIIAVWAEGNRDRSSRGIELVLKFNDEFDTELFKNKRREVANALLSGKELTLSNPDLESIGDILNYFEIIGVLLSRGILDTYFVRIIFSYYICHYYPVLRYHIAQEREFDPTVWEEVDWLYKQLMVYDYKPLWFLRKHFLFRKISDPSKDDIDRFLKEEAHL